MSRLIYADEAIEYVKSIVEVHRYYHPRSTTENFPISDVIDRINQVPTVDAVPVVRCAECKYLDESLAMGGWDGSCKYWNTHSTVYSGFCSFGEKVTE